MIDMDCEKHNVLIEDAFHSISNENKQKWLDAAAKLNTTIHELGLVSVAEYAEANGIVYKAFASAEDWEHWASRLSLSPVNLVIGAINFYIARLRAVHPIQY